MGDGFVEWVWESELDQPDSLDLNEFMNAVLAYLEQQRAISILFCDNHKIHQLNQRFRHIDKPTDVLSFPSSAVPGFDHQLGDIAIAVPQAKEQALALGHSLEIELRFLILHGLLHLLGHDHEKDQGEMIALQRSIQNAFPEFLGSKEATTP